MGYFQSGIFLKQSLVSSHLSWHLTGYWDMQVECTREANSWNVGMGATKWAHCKKERSLMVKHTAKESPSIWLSLLPLSINNFPFQAEMRLKLLWWAPPERLHHAILGRQKKNSDCSLETAIWSLEIQCYVGTQACSQVVKSPVLGKEPITRVNLMLGLTSAC